MGERIVAFTVTGNDFSTGDGVSPTIRAGADRQNTTPMVVVPVQDGRGMEKAQNGLGVGEPGDPMYTLDCTGAQAVAYEIVPTHDVVGTLGQDDLTQGCTTVQAAMSGLLQVMTPVTIPCQVDGSPVAATLRGFGHGWQGQHNTTNAVVQSINGDVAGTLDANYGKGTGERNGVEREVVAQYVWEYDGYNQKLDDSGVHRTLRIGRDSSDFVAYSELASRRDTDRGGSVVLTAWPLNERGRSDGSHLEMGEEGVYNTLAAGDGSSSRRQLVLTEEDRGERSSSVTGTTTNESHTEETMNTPSSMSERITTGETAATLTASSSPNRGGTEGQKVLDTSLVVRRLTPLECELLMGWDPNWTAEGVEEDGTVVKMADTHRYRMCGNGVVANVGEWLGVRYLEAKEAVGGAEG